MVVISNSSPLINLSIIGRLNLLERKFSEIVIPKAVWREVVVDGIGKPGAKEVARFRFSGKLYRRALAEVGEMRI